MIFFLNKMEFNMNELKCFYTGMYFNNPVVTNTCQIFECGFINLDDICPITHEIITNIVPCNITRKLIRKFVKSSEILLCDIYRCTDDYFEYNDYTYGDFRYADEDDDTYDDDYEVGCDYNDDYEVGCDYNDDYEVGCDYNDDDYEVGCDYNDDDYEVGCDYCGECNECYENNKIVECNNKNQKRTNLNNIKTHKKQKSKLSEILKPVYHDNKLDYEHKHFKERTFNYKNYI